jgi:hypothetical protein
MNNVLQQYREIPQGDRGFGAEAERPMVDKRADDFAAGTLVVWDVNVLTEHVDRIYRAGHPLNPTLRHRGTRAHAEPALPGWSMLVERPDSAIVLSGAPWAVAVQGFNRPCAAERRSGAHNEPLGLGPVRE